MFLTFLARARYVAAGAIVIASLVTYGCARDPNVSPDKMHASTDSTPDSMQDAREGVARLLREFPKAFNENNADSLERFFAADALIWVDKGETVNGWPAIRSRLAGTFEKFQVDERTHPLDVRLIGSDAAFVRILTELSLTPRGGGDEIERKYREVVLLERTAGAWRIVSVLDQPITRELLEADLNAAR